MDTARCESSKSDVDQRFKDLLEASSLGTPAAHRIRCSAPADIVEDVRLRVMERGSPQILPGHAASIQVLPAAAGHDAQLAAGQPQAQEPGSASELENLAAAAQVKTSRRETAEALADAPSDRARHLITTFGILGSAAIAVFILSIGTLNAFHVLALALSALTLGLAVYAGSRLRAIHPPAPRRRAAVLLAAILLVAGAGGLAFNLPRHGATSEQLAGSHTQVIKELAAEAAARKRAVTWILGQVSRAAVVSCDSQVCGDLVSAGFPSGNVLTLGPGSNDPLGSVLVVATGPIRAHFGSRLASVYAPAVIASFGSGNARIDIRLRLSRRCRQIPPRSAGGAARPEGRRRPAAGEQPDRGLGRSQGTTSQRRG